jgi:uncharacterized membrane protein (UPF0127 family)
MNANAPSRLRSRVTLALIAFIVVGCASAARSDSPRVEPLSAFPQAPLVIESRSARHSFNVWVADSPARRSQGLMFVKRLEPGTGMLFLYNEPQPISMWMKNTFISLDMLFIASDGRITRIAAQARPHSTATIASMGYVSAVIEIGGGEAARLGIQNGDRVSHPAFQPAAR